MFSKWHIGFIQGLYKLRYSYRGIELDGFSTFTINGYGKAVYFIVFFYFFNPSKAYFCLFKFLKIQPPKHFYKYLFKGTKYQKVNRNIL